jgi:hypothetical protein
MTACAVREKPVSFDAGFFMRYASLTPSLCGRESVVLWNNIMPK